MKKTDHPSVIVHVYVKPNAKQTRLIGKDERGLIIALKARPQEGEANDELINFLSELCGVPKSKIIIRRGAASRIKQVEMPWNESITRIGICK